MVSDPVAPWAETVLHTADDLAALPDDAWRYELVKGRLVRMSPAGFDHGYISVRLASAMLDFATARGLGLVVGAETGFVISAPGEPETVLAPDAAFVVAARVPPTGSPGRRGFPRLAPDLVVEVASPSQGRAEIRAKAKVWLDSGVRLVWVVWPSDRQVDVYVAGQDGPRETLDASGQLDGGEVLPGFDFELSRLWG